MRLVRRLPPGFVAPAIRLTGALLLLAGLALALDRAGRSARRELPGFRVERVADGREALARWRELGVHGRVLLWLDRALPIEGVPEGEVLAFLRGGVLPTHGVQGAFLQLALRADVARRVIYVVPDDRWESYSMAARREPGLTPWRRGFVQMLDGVPIVSISARDRASVIHERPLVFLSSASRQFFGDAFVDGILRDGDGADLVLVAP